MDIRSDRWSTIEPDELLTARQLADLIRERLHAVAGNRAPIGRSTILGAIQRGELPAIERGRAYLVRWDDFLAWFQPPAPAPSTALEREVAHA